MYSWTVRIHVTTALTKKTSYIYEYFWLPLKLQPSKSEMRSVTSKLLTHPLCFKVIWSNLFYHLQFKKKKRERVCFFLNFHRRKWKLTFLLRARVHASGREETNVHTLTADWCAFLRAAGGPRARGGVECVMCVWVCVIRRCCRGDHVSALIFKYALKIQTLMSGIKDSSDFNTITSLCMLLS